MPLKEFFFTERNLDRVTRFSNQIRVRDESVSEHSFHTAVYAMVLADMERANGREVDVEKLLRCCLIHDLEESMTGDILHGFKYSDPELLKNMKKMGAEFYKRVVGELPDEISRGYVSLWEEAKAGGIEGQILEAADKIEALMYCMEEYSLGNKKFKPIIDHIVESIEEIDLQSVRDVMKGLEIPK